MYDNCYEHLITHLELIRNISYFSAYIDAILQEIDGSIMQYDFFTNERIEIVIMCYNQNHHIV